MIASVKCRLVQCVGIGPGPAAKLNGRWPIDPDEILIRKLKEHSRLCKEDVGEIRRLSFRTRELEPNEDLVRQGDRPKVSALVLKGMVSRYHLLPSGRRQYLSFHMAGDMPDSQSLFVERMDHAVCAIGYARVGLIRHSELLAAFERCSSLTYAIWRETLIDAVIFRAAISNNSARPPLQRMAHLFCELYYRSRVSGLAMAGAPFSSPFNLGQLGEALGMSLATVNRVLSQMREDGLADLQGGEVIVHNWDKLSGLADFNPRYLHLKKSPL